MATTTPLIARPDRVHLEQCGLCHAPTGQPCNAKPGITHTGRRWELAITAPSRGEPFGHRRLVPDGDTCRPTVEDTYWWNHTSRDSRFPWESERVAIIHRGACLGCGWAGPTRVDANDAIEDAHDHAWPGWRALPIVPRQPHDAKPADIAKWRTQISRIYRAAGIDVDHWTQQHAPFRTTRTAGATASWSTWNGGYDICGTITTATPPARRTAHTPTADTQLELW